VLEVIDDYLEEYKDDPRPCRCTSVTCVTRSNHCLTNARMKQRLMKAVALDAASSKSSQAKRPAMVKRSANQSPHNILVQYCTASRRTQRGSKHDRHLHQVDLGVSIIHLGRRSKKKGKQNDGSC